MNAAVLVIEVRWALEQARLAVVEPARIQWAINSLERIERVVANQAVQDALAAEGKS